MPTPVSLVSRTGNQISTIDEWRDELDEREKTKFVRHYSAYETARAWTEPNRVPTAIAQLFQREPLESFCVERAVVEAKTPFDEYGGPRHHDLLLRARSPRSGRLAVIGIESKVNEDLGGTLEDELARAIARGKRNGYVSRMPDRLRGLSLALLNRELAPEQWYDPRDADLRYQLLTALAGTLVEASIAQADIAMLLIHEFHTPISKPGIAERSSRRIEDLLARFGREPDGRLPVELALGPFEVRGGGKVPAGATFYIAKLATIVCAP